ncbi:MAG: hypothetical protein GY925_17795 [Actinomycetia bacterium]|nr:hypothetical protein [Actinomycetes bacterium]
MTAVADLINSTRTDYLDTGTRTILNALNGALTDSATSVTLLRDPAQVATNSRLSVDFEDMHVWQQTGSTVEVERGMNGTTATSHSAGALIYVNPNFSAGQILRAMNDVLGEISSTEPGLFQVKTVTIPYATSTTSYDLTDVTDNVIRIDNVRYEIIGSQKEWPLVKSFDFARDMPTADFPSGFAFIPKRAPGLQSGARMRITYMCPYGELAGTSTSTVEAQTGIFTEATRILKVGAALNLTAGLEIRRADVTAHADGRRAQDVQGGDPTRASRNMERLMARWLSEERGRLMAQYPMRRY